SERVRGRPPVTDPAAVPAAVSQLTEGWLTAALGCGVEGARVTSFSFGEGTDGTSSRRAIDVRWNEAGVAAGLPAAVYSKTSPGFVNRVLIGVTGAAAAEALFYSRIRPALELGAPAGYYGGFDAQTSRSLVLIEDIVRTRQATFGDTATHVDRAAAESMIDEMARYHGGLWEDPRLTGAWSSLKDAHAWQQTFNAKTGFDRGALVGARMAREQVPAALWARRGELRPAFVRSLEENVRLPATLLHQDVHPGNWFRLPDGSMNLYDWQAIARGNWALDVAYALSAGLTVEDRRAWERELVERYLQRLGEAGGAPPPFADAWLAYRQQMFHGFFFWTYTLLVGKVQELQKEEHVRELIRRTGQAIVDHESLDAI
ncbi:MAG: hypothetical protein JWM31_3396, partial [Solirubrobacterales bacterium]|nr:hypothetical protein [Solirubrobacterales bacterium]